MFHMLGKLWSMLANVFGAGHVASHRLDKLAKQAVIKSQQSLNNETVKYQKHLAKHGKTQQELNQSIEDIFADFDLNDDD